MTNRLGLGGATRTRREARFGLRNARSRVGHNTRGRREGKVVRNVVPRAKGREREGERSLAKISSWKLPSKKSMYEMLGELYAD